RLQYCKQYKRFPKKMTWSNYQEFYDWVWDESIWLPKITSWKNVKANRLPIIEDVGGLYLCIPITIMMMVLRYIFESWRFLFYFCVTIYGTLTLGKYNCLYRLDTCFKDFKTHVLHIDLYVYYLAEVSMYIALSISQFTDVKRKDFLQNLVHHILTLALLMYSFSSGYYHIGAVIVFMHDVSDVFLEAAKVFHYAKLQKLCDAFFVVFAIVFYISRLYVLPFR
ncbi:hypothetical protein QZH41_015162, partial [Actinostola sp. cb2023]